MELSKIRKGDVLVLFPELSFDVMRFYKRNYIIFIAKECAETRGGQTSIAIFAAIDLNENLQVSKSIGDLSISANISGDNVNTATLKDYMELAMKLKANGYKYNKHSKEIEKA